MEYRSSRRMHRTADRQLLASACIVAAVYIVIVFGISASRAGTWVARTLIAPVFGLRTAGEQGQDAVFTASNAPETIPQTAVLDLPAFACYALQMGVYANEENARAQAESLQSLGAGGYIKADGMRYRVLAAGYADRESFNKVKAQLVSEGVQSTLCTLEANACTLSISASNIEILAYRQAISRIVEMQQAISKQAIDFDKQQGSAEEGLGALVTVRGTLAEQQGEFENGISEATAVSEAVRAFYLTVMLHLDDTVSIPDPNRNQIAAAYKYAGLLAAERVIDVYRAVETA